MCSSDLPNSSDYDELADVYRSRFFSVIYQPKVEAGRRNRQDWLRRLRIADDHRRIIPMTGTVLAFFPESLRFWVLFSLLSGFSRLSYRCSEVVRRVSHENRVIYHLCMISKRYKIELMKLSDN